MWGRIQNSSVAIVLVEWLVSETIAVLVMYDIEPVDFANRALQDVETVMVVEKGIHHIRIENDLRVKQTSGEETGGGLTVGARSCKNSYYW